MPRVARIVVPGIPHHIIQRGNNKQDVFFADEDRTKYLRYLREESRKYGLNIASYCLMSNHVHIVAIPETSQSMSRGIGRAHLRYTQYFNGVYSCSGHMWQNRFRSYPMDEDHFINALRYGEQNPIRAGLVQIAVDYPWSSAAAHTGQPDLSGLLDLEWWKTLFDLTDWFEVLQQGVPDEMKTTLMNQWKTGLPLGSDDFVKNLEVQTKRKLRPPQMGRPRKR